MGNIVDAKFQRGSTEADVALMKAINSLTDEQLDAFLIDEVENKGHQTIDAYLSEAGGKAKLIEDLPSLPSGLKKTILDSIDSRQAV